MDRWLLVVMDACRYDVLNRLVVGYNVDEAYSRATCSPQWFRKEWTEDYGCFYISSNPHVSIFDDATNDDVVEIHERVPVGRGQKKTQPSLLTEKYLQNKDDYDRCVLHYMIPHQPYFNGPPYVCGDNGTISSYVADTQFFIECILPTILSETHDRPVAITADHGELLGEDDLWGHTCGEHELLHSVPWVRVQ